MAVEVTKHLHAGLTRVNVKFARTYNVAKYESVELVIGLEDDVKTSETVQDAFKRVRSVCQGEFETICKQIEGKYPTHGRQ